MEELRLQTFLWRRFFDSMGYKKMVVSNRDAKFTFKIWKYLFGGTGIQINFNTTYHPKTDGLIKRINHILEDMLRMYVMDKLVK